MPSLEMSLGVRIRSKVNWVQNNNTPILMVIICSYLKHVQYGEERVDFMLVTCITSVF